MNKRMFYFGFFFGIIFVIFSCFFYVKEAFKTNDFDYHGLELVDLNGNDINLNDNFDKPLIINLWETSCAPCVKELLDFDSISREYKNEVNFVFISDESIEKIIVFKNKKNYKLHFLKSKLSFSRKKLNYYLPSTFFYNSKRTKMYEINGSANKAEIEKGIKSILIK